MAGFRQRLAGRLRRLGLWLRGVKVQWGHPQPVKVAIFEATNADYLTPLCAGAKSIVIGIPAKTLYLSWMLIGGVAWLVLRGRGVQESYFAVLLRRLRPAIVITFIDNSDLFYRVARINHTRMRFLAIQNAARYDVVELLPEKAQHIFLPEFACFGEYEKDLYTSKGAQVGAFYPIGSLRESYFRRFWKDAHATAPAHSYEYDLCVVAEASPGWNKLYPGSEDAIGRVASYAVRYAKEHGLRIVIAGKRDVSPGQERASIHQRDVELAWYQRYIGTETPITPRVRDQFTTYGLISKSRLSLALMSTALREAANRGCKVLFCNFSKDPRWNFCVDGVWSLTKDSYEEFSDRVSHLLAMSEQDYLAQSAKMSAYVMNNDDAAPTYVQLEKIIAAAVAG
ncbi:hypothetical protein RS694_17735 [Rhodoferax saidenbachensis]|uniref:Glycosyl transferase family 1 domain-containing protein n=2 Tax=Rhodoferax saidenbachensis TaxID=1484693 RepID=A0A1P8KDY8_9BURK|nr:hypothetical protein RS694_17735 [Rhodoferax saidenbachensis]